MIGSGGKPVGDHVLVAAIATPSGWLEQMYGGG